MVSLSGIDVRTVDLKTQLKMIGSAPTDLGIGAVPDGMKRWITFVKYINEYIGINTVFLCSGTSALNAASGIAKDRQSFGKRFDMVGYPEPPSNLFSIAASKFLTAFSAKGKVALLVQYYDE